MSSDQLPHVIMPRESRVGVNISKTKFFLYHACHTEFSKSWLINVLYSDKFQYFLIHPRIK